ncbi:uncharacterized protein [Triticum aestivum]|uniref:uncharacterized protein n=1 Tax=Triticum aestivum TaxID=4565 RepID=UPI001D02BC13|nr:uncharacterized protein LOC123043339 [Triticum aestivum]
MGRRGLLLRVRTRCGHKASRRGGAWRCVVDYAAERASPRWPDPPDRRRGLRAAWAAAGVRLRVAGGCAGSSTLRACGDGAVWPMVVGRPGGDGRRCAWWWCFHLAALCAGRQGSGLDRGGGVHGVPAAASGQLPSWTRAWYVPTIASGQLPSKTVEVGPSRMRTVLLP